MARDDAAWLDWLRGLRLLAARRASPDLEANRVPDRAPDRLSRPNRSDRRFAVLARVSGVALLLFGLLPLALWLLASALDRRPAQRVWQPAALVALETPRQRFLDDDNVRCANSRQGARLVADELGALCAVEEVPLIAAVVIF